MSQSNNLVEQFRTVVINWIIKSPAPTNEKKKRQSHQTMSVYIRIFSSIWNKYIIKHDWSSQVTKN